METMLHLFQQLEISEMVIIKKVHTVKPAVETPSGKMYLSESDQASAITHAPTIYIYRHPTTNLPFEALVQTLISSLSQTLVEFYPLAGRLHFIPNAGGRLELECNGEGAALIEAESNLRVIDLGDFSPSPIISTLIPKIDYDTTPIHETPLILVQVTNLSCGAITVGCAISHNAFDGQGAMVFISEWCKRCRGGNDYNHVKPFLDRTILKRPSLETTTTHEKSDDGLVLLDYSPLPLLVGRCDDKEERAKETVVASLKLSAKQVAELKSKANMDNEAGVRLHTRYEAIAAHMWRCSSKARHHTSEQPTRLRIAIDARNRLKPPVPPNYLGNVVARIAVITTSTELLNNPLSHIADIIRQRVKNVDDKYVRESFAYLERENDVNKFRNFHSLGCPMGAFFGNPNFEITSWLSLPLYGADFGWGCEDYMGPGGIGYDGKCFVLPGHDEDGSVLVLLRLQVECMDEFKKCFYEGI